MQRIECISLCEIMHELYEKEPNWETILDRACKRAGFNKCERLYFGSSFCGQYFLHMRQKEVEALYEVSKKRGIKLTLVLPLFTEQNLTKSKEMIKEYALVFGDRIDEVTVNDYGMLEYMDFEYGKKIRLNMGRLFMKDYRDPRYEAYFNSTHKPKGFTNDLKDYIKLHDVRGIEFDPSHRVLDFSEKPEGVVIGLYTPYCYETVGQICQMAGMHQPIDKKFRPNEPCDQSCEENRIRYELESGHQWMKLGRAVYFKNENCEVIGTDLVRLIYSPLDGEVKR